MPLTAMRGTCRPRCTSTVWKEAMKAEVPFARPWRAGRWSGRRSSLGTTGRPGGAIMAAAR
eukprot:5526093-Alexandrium_andersonii.AAC.1